ncbi:MAG TPA: hypothetical protein DCF63_12270 [Planctomycetaceae bacterium]|nr:hypothetical protein [Planctomycetaceae bacterium]
MRWFMVVLLLCSLLVGCGDPPLYPVTGKVTLGGKSYERLLVYFHPANGKVTAFTMGVGETTRDGTLKMRSTGGNGLAKGKYRVSFACFVTPGAGTREPRSNSSTRASDEPEVATKSETNDSRKADIKDIVPAPYNSSEQSPVVIEVSSSGSNVLEFDIPAK